MKSSTYFFDSYQVLKRGRNSQKNRVKDNCYFQFSIASLWKAKHYINFLY